MPSRFRLSLLALVALSGGLVTTLPVVAAHADETTIGGGNLRQSWDADEPGLSPTAIQGDDFGRLWSATVPGTSDSTPNQVYAQPIVADGRVIAVTDDNAVVALDPTDGDQLWSRQFEAPWTPTSCGDLVPHVGITSTPVYDPSTKTVYLVAKKATSTAAGAELDMHALDVDTGAERPGWPVVLQGTAANGGQSLNPATANQRAGLLLLDGSVYAAFASHCDQGAYVGLVAGVNTSTRSISLWADETQTASDEAGIWQSGGGLMADRDGPNGSSRIFLATGNGVSPSAAPGSAPPTTLAESVVQLAVGSTGLMTAQDFFSPANNAGLDQYDADLGSGAPVGLPDSFGSPSHPHLLVVVGKDGNVYLLDRDHLGGMRQGPNGTDLVVSSLHLKGVWGRAAVFDGGDANSHYIYLVPSTAPMQALRVTDDASGTPTLSLVSTSSDTFPYQSGSPVVTSDGQDPTSAVVWVVKCDAQTGTNAVLEAYPAVPPASGAWIPLETYPLGTVAKFIQPATDGDRLFVGTRNGQVLAFGSPVTAAITAAPVDAGPVPVGSSTDGTATVRLGAGVDGATVTGVATTGPFSVGDLTLPADVDRDSGLQVPVTFTPTASGPATGVLEVTAQMRSDSGDLGPAHTYDFSLSGFGTEQGFRSTPATLDFGEVSTSGTDHQSITLQNTGTDDETITAATLSAGSPFSLLDPLPDGGIEVDPEQSVSLGIAFTPPAAERYDDTLQLTYAVDGADGTATSSVAVTGTGFGGAPHLAVSTTQLDFGDVAPGRSATQTFVVTNDGTALLTINKAAPPGSPYTVSGAVGEGQQLEPGDSLTVSVTYRPTSGQRSTGSYSLTGNDGQGPVLVTAVGNENPWTGPISTSLGCLDDLSNRRAAGNPIVSYPCNGTAAQLWTLGSDGTLQFGTSRSLWCADAHAAGTAGTPLVLESCTTARRDKFQWRTDDTLRSTAAKLCIGARKGSTAANTPIELQACSTVAPYAAAQYWDASAVLAARGEMSSALGAAGQLCVGTSARSGSPVQLQRCTLGTGQLVTHSGTALEVLRQCLDIPGRTITSRTRVSAYRCNGAPGQQWVVRTGGKVVNPASGLCLDVPGSTTTPGTQLQVYTCNGTAAQRWTLPG